jgi:hypothetical protein
MMITKKIIQKIPVGGLLVVEAELAEQTTDLSLAIDTRLLRLVPLLMLATSESI